MSFKLSFDTDNDWFSRGARTAVTAILHDVAFRVQRHVENEGPIMDGNGNKIGEWEWTEPERHWLPGQEAR